LRYRNEVPDERRVKSTVKGLLKDMVNMVKTW
jgi:hypothetical protein